VAVIFRPGLCQSWQAYQYHGPINRRRVTCQRTVLLPFPTQAAKHRVCRACSGGSTAPAFRALVAGDIPALAYVSPGRLINTRPTITGGGDLSEEEYYCLFHPGKLTSCLPACQRRTQRPGVQGPGGR